MCLSHIVAQVKTRALVKGELKIKDELPEWLQQGLFANPGRTYQCAARYALEPSHILDDRVRVHVGVFAHKADLSTGESA